MLSIDSEAGSVTVPGCAGETITAAIEDFRAAPSENDLAIAIQESIDTLEFSLPSEIDF